MRVVVVGVRRGVTGPTRMKRDNVALADIDSALQIGNLDRVARALFTNANDHARTSQAIERNVMEGGAIDEEMARRVHMGPDVYDHLHFSDVDGVLGQALDQAKTRLGKHAGPWY